MTSPCRKCGALMEGLSVRFCSVCGTPASMAAPIKHEDALEQFAHHESVLQNYRAMFLVSETFSVSVAATRLDNRALVLLFTAFGLSWLVVWIVITTLRSRVVEFFEEHDEDGALMHYHHLVEGLAHRAGFWFFTVVFPTMFALFWLSLLLLSYGVIRA